MKTIHRAVRIVCLALILSAGLVHFTYQNAYACADKSYGGEWDQDADDCIKKVPLVDCFVCIAEPIE